jgi:CHAT domain-containing protein
MTAPAFSLRALSWAAALAISACAAPGPAGPDAGAAARDRLRACAVERERGDPVQGRAWTEDLLAELGADPNPDGALVLDARQELGRILVLLGDTPQAIEILEDVLAARERELEPGAIPLEAARVDLAHACRAARDFARVRDLSGQTMAALEGAVAEDQPELLQARLVHAVALSYLGDPGSARALAEATLERFLRSSSEHDPDLQLARLYTAFVLWRAGATEEAHPLNVQAEAALAKILPPGHPSLLRARINLATTTRDLGDFPRALELYLQVAEDGTRALSESHPYVLSAQGDAAYLLTELGRAREALALEERLLAVQERLKGRDHPDAIGVRGAMGLTLRALGDLDRARTLQEEVVKNVDARVQNDDPESIRAHGNLAITILEQGDPWTARAEFERIGEIYAKTLPEDHPDLLRLWQNLSVALVECGDFEAARTLEERTIEGLARTLPDDHPMLQVARVSLAGTLSDLGENEEARDLLEKVLAILSPTMEEDHAYLLVVRENLATVLRRLDERVRALELDEKNFEVLSRTRDPDSIALQQAKLNLAISRRGAGQYAESCALAESALEVLRRTLPPGHIVTRRALMNLSMSKRAARDLPGTCAAARELCAALAQGTAEILLRCSPREAEEATEPDREAISWVIEVAGLAREAPGGEELAREAFELVEGRRALGLRAARLQGLLPESAAIDGMRAREREASQRIADLVREGGSREELDEARRALDQAQQNLAAQAGLAPGAQVYLSEIRAEDLRSGLGPGEAMVGFWRFKALGEVEAKTPEDGSDQRILAHVLAADGSLTRVDLGAAPEIEALVQGFRDSIGEDRGRGLGIAAGSDKAGSDAALELERRIFEPLRAALAGARAITVAFDGVLTLVPLEALPETGSGANLIGDRIRVRVVSALAERSWPVPQPAASTRLLALGGLEYDEVPGTAANVPAERGSSSPIFDPLPATKTEVEAIAALLQTSGKGGAVLLEGAEGSAATFAAMAPGARWVHLATHGWFAAESSGPGVDATPLDSKSGIGRRRSAMDQVRGGMPMALCGLALAGANRRDGAAGVITAAEIATLDLESCEMAILSACDTNVGVLRAGQGVASLQKALHMAGARSVVTSLWKVPDAATAELMVDFYRRIWVEGQRKDEALWAAKTQLRDARDAEGRPRYSVRDWAGWVLTGVPD